MTTHYECPGAGCGGVRWDASSLVTGVPGLPRTLAAGGGLRAEATTLAPRSAGLAACHRPTVGRRWSAAATALHEGAEDSAHPGGRRQNALQGRLRLEQFSFIDCVGTHVREVGGAGFGLRRWRTPRRRSRPAAGGQELLMVQESGRARRPARATASRRVGSLSARVRNAISLETSKGRGPLRRPSRHRPVSTVEVDARAAS